MSSLGDLAEPFEHQLLTLGEAAQVLRIGRSLGYQLAHEYLNSGGALLGRRRLDYGADVMCGSSPGILPHVPAPELVRAQTHIASFRAIVPAVVLWLGRGVP